MFSVPNFPLRFVCIVHQQRQLLPGLPRERNHWRSASLRHHQSGEARSTACFLCVCGSFVLWAHGAKPHLVLCPFFIFFCAESRKHDPCSRQSFSRLGF